MTQMRIGDLERDAAAAALGEHYAAGRLTKEEYDERIDRVWAAKFEADLAPLFSDLPRRSRQLAPAQGGAATNRSTTGYRRPGPPGFHPLMLLVPVIVAGIITVGVIVTGAAGWLFLLFFLWCFGGFGSRRRQRHWAHSRWV